MFFQVMGFRLEPTQAFGEQLAVAFTLPLPQDIQVCLNKETVTQFTQKRVGLFPPQSLKGNFWEENPLCE